MCTCTYTHENPGVFEEEIQVYLLIFNKQNKLPRHDWGVYFVNNSLKIFGARCSSVVRAFAYGTMVRRIDPSWWTHEAISRSSQCPKTGATKAVLCAIPSVG